MSDKWVGEEEKHRRPVESHGEASSFSMKQRAHSKKKLKQNRRVGLPAQPSRQEEWAKAAGK